MDKIDEFINYIDKESLKVKKFIQSSKKIRVVSHLDADGLSSAIILTFTLRSLDVVFKLSIVKQLDEEEIINLSKEECDLYIFSDLGSGALEEINKLLLSKSKVIILDHHEIKKNFVHPNLIHINPHIFDIDGGIEISGSGVSYLVSKNIINDLRLSKYAIIGTIGDMQNFNTKLNKIILTDAVNLGSINVKKGLKLFGRNSRPLHKALSYCTDPFIPDITGNDANAIQFLNDLGIDYKKENNEIKTISELSDEDKQKLVSGIILKANLKDHDKLIGDIIELNDEIKTLSDAKEFASFLNACGRLGKYSSAISYCLANNKNEKLKDVDSILSNYKRELVNYLKWVEENKSNFIKDNGIMIIDSKHNIKDTMIGTICSILINSNNINVNTIVGLANNGKYVKVSVRTKKELNLKEIIEKIVKEVGGVSGGHKMAAGAEIPIGKEEEFINKIYIGLKEVS